MFWFGPSCKLMYLYIEISKTIVDTFSHILNLIFIKERVLFVLGLGLWFLSKINIFVANLHFLFVSCLLRIQILL